MNSKTTIMSFRTKDMETMKKFERFLGNCFDVESGYTLKNNGKDEITTITETFPNSLSYNFNGSYLCFVYNGVGRVIPYHNESHIKLLQSLGYQRDPYLFVPFTDGSFPEKDKERWKRAIRKAKFNESF